MMGNEDKDGRRSGEVIFKLIIATQAAIVVGFALVCLPHFPTVGLMLKFVVEM